MTGDPPGPSPFAVRLPAPDLRPYLRGGEIPGFHHFDSQVPGPHLGILALMHGNEIAGATALVSLLESQFRPRRGRLTLGFVNLAAFARFDPAHPTASRFVDEDLNRVWDRAILSNGQDSLELRRAREILPAIERIDRLLDLHSMLWPSDPLFLCGATARGQALARAIAVPDLVVADPGHEAGRRLIDLDRFTDPAGDATAILLEAGQHWHPDSVAMTQRVIARLLGLAALAPPPPPPPSPPRFVRVTAAITAATSQFRFVRPYRGGETVPAADTLIAFDGAAEIRTPYPNCVLIMPSLRPSRGHTAVRLGIAEPA